MTRQQLPIRRARDESVRQFPRTPGGIHPVIIRLAVQADEAPDWWTPARDNWMRLFWKEEPYLASAIFSLEARNAGFQWVLTGPQSGCIEAAQLLNTAEFGEGWQQLMLMVSEDLYTQDNGGFIEIIRPARAEINKRFYPALAVREPKSKDLDWYAVLNRYGKVERVKADQISDDPADLPVGLAHLDAGKCIHTGDPLIPVRYTDRYGGLHDLSYWQVISLSDMPSSIEEMNAVGFCMVSRVLRSAQTVRDWAIYRSEKISGRFARAVHLTNIDAQVITDALQQADSYATQEGLLRYSQPIIANTLDPNAQPFNVTIPLASLPEQWSEDEAMRWYTALIALAAGEHYSFFAPMPGRRLGSAREVEVQERQARGKSSRLFIESLTTKFNNAAVFPPGVSFSFKEKDPEEQKGNEEAAQRRAKTRRERIESGEITPQIARQIASDEGDLNRTYLAQLGEQDLTPGTPQPAQTPVPQEADLVPAQVPAPPAPKEEQKQTLVGQRVPPAWGDRPVVITKEDIARALAKWDARLPAEAQGLLQAQPGTEEEMATQESTHA